MSLTCSASSELRFLKVDFSMNSFAPDLGERESIRRSHTFYCPCWASVPLKRSTRIARHWTMNIRPNKQHTDNHAGEGRGTKIENIDISNSYKTRHLLLRALWISASVLDYMHDGWLGGWTWAYVATDHLRVSYCLSAWRWNTTSAGLKGLQLGVILSNFMC